MPKPSNAPDPLCGLSTLWLAARRRDTSVAEVVADLLGLGAERPKVGRHCPQCGSSEHGRPWLESPAGHHALHLSLSRTGDLLLVALTDCAPVGVDAETVTPEARQAIRKVALHPAESVSDDAAATVLWTRKEALLKATGRGLGLSPHEVRMTSSSQPAGVLAWPGGNEHPHVWLSDLVLTTGVVGAVALLGIAPDQVIASGVTLATQPGTARSETDR